MKIHHNIKKIIILGKLYF